MLTEIRAAEIIQKKWRQFAYASKTDPLRSREIAALLGKPLKNLSEVRESFLANKIIVQVRGTLGNPLEGHSCFYVNFKRRHLEFMQPSEIQKLEIEPDYIAKHPVIHYDDPKYIGAHAVIRSTATTFSNIDRFISYFTEVLDKGALFELHFHTADFLEIAYRAEIDNIQDKPYSYGLHYNCNTFVVNVLNRILQYQL